MLKRWLVGNSLKTRYQRLMQWLLLIDGGSVMLTSEITCRRI
jgi:hypothetical protein